jgi:hypothetical protein
LESDVLAPLGSFSALSWTLNTVGGAASLPSEKEGVWLKVTFVEGVVTSAQAATARTAHT